MVICNTFYALFKILRDVDSNDVTLTAVSMSHTGRMLFTGTSNGTLRCMKFPLTVPGEWNEHQGHGSAITKVSVSPYIMLYF